MIFRVPFTGAVVSGLLALSACTGAPIYQTLPGTGLSTSNLGGAGLHAVGSITPQQITPLTGSVNRATNAVALNDGTYLFLDANGFDATGSLSDGTNFGYRLDSAGTGVFTNTYAYVIPVRYTYFVGPVSSTYRGTVGIETRGADMPTGGAAHYAGEALGVVSSATGVPKTMTNGTSVVDVNFRTGRVNVTMGWTTTAPVDAIAGTNMQIVGTSFSGGTWRTYKNGALVNVTGLGSTTSSIGDFYGYDPAISAPDEVAGVVLMKGGSATVYGMYLAD